MPKPTQPPGNVCPHDGQGCDLQCKYNYYEGDDLTIDSYELKCLNCGWRETIGFRSDEYDPEDGDPKCCPFCDQCGLNPGINPCESA